MTATHHPARRTRRPRTRSARPRGLRLGWGWVFAVLVMVGIAKTWPLYTALTVILLSGGLILRAIRPARLVRLWNGLDSLADRRRALPATGRGTRTLQQFLAMHPDRFEQAIADLALEDRDRVHSAQRVGGANDRGADVLVQLKDGRRVMIQCKRYRSGNNVTSEDVQKTNGTYRDIHNCHSAVIVTTAAFTRDAFHTNTLLPQPIRLIDGTALTAWANGHTPAPW